VSRVGSNPVFISKRSSKPSLSASSQIGAVDDDFHVVEDTVVVPRPGRDLNLISLASVYLPATVLRTATVSNHRQRNGWRISHAESEVYSQDQNQFLTLTRVFYV
jgi:hypothetical protein